MRGTPAARVATHQHPLSMPVWPESRDQPASRDGMPARRRCDPGRDSRAWATGRAGEPERTDRLDDQDRSTVDRGRRASAATRVATAVAAGPARACWPRCRAAGRSARWSAGTSPPGCTWPGPGRRSGTGIRPRPPTWPCGRTRDGPSPTPCCWSPAWPASWPSRLAITAGRAGGPGAQELRAGLAVASVALSWTVVQTVFTLHYARLYYGHPVGGIDFNQEAPAALWRLRVPGLHRRDDLPGVRHRAPDLGVAGGGAAPRAAVVPAGRGHPGHHHQPGGRTAPVAGAPDSSQPPDEMAAGGEDTGRSWRDPWAARGGVP